MISRINKFVLAFLIIGAVVYIMLLNRESISVALSPSWSFEAVTGLVLIGAFLLGVLCTAVVSLFFGVKSYFRERRLQSQEKHRKAFYDRMLEARGFQAAGDWDRARKEWQDLIKKDPTNIIARVELSECLQGAGENREALKILDGARSTDPNNIEVLFRAAELNLELNNKTAAVDNLALILYNHPNERAAEMARTLSEQLDRLDDAFEYQEKLESLGFSNTQDEEARARIEYKRILRDSGEEDETLRKALKGLLKKRHNFVPALHTLAQLEVKNGKIDEGAQLLAKAARASGSPVYWKEAAQLWIDHQLPDRAVAAARSATRDSSGQQRITTEIDLIRLYIALTMYEDAKRALDQLPALAKNEKASIEGEIAREILVLKGMCLNSMGEYRESARIWKQLSDADYQIKSAQFEKTIGSNGSGPAPALSTP